VCTYVPFLLDAHAIKTLSILKLEFFNILGHVGLLMCFMLNVNSKLYKYIIIYEREKIQKYLLHTYTNQLLHTN
jgi:hypothetical protein